MSSNLEPESEIEPSSRMLYNLEPESEIEPSSRMLSNLEPESEIEPSSGSCLEHSHDSISALQLSCNDVGSMLDPTVPTNPVYRVVSE